MNKQILFSLAIGLVFGSLISYGIISANQTERVTLSEIKPANESLNHNVHDNSMNDMNESLKGKSGDAFDKEFIIQMIEHHQGAIDMANQVKTNAGHDELKKMADAIISAQTSEIEMMKQWQKEWGYTQ